MADILLGMHNRLKISQLFNELVGLIENEQQIDRDTKAQLKSLQIKVQFQISKDDSLQADLPKVAPEKWLERKNKSETPADFIMRVYAPWIGRGLGKPDIRRLDVSLYNNFYTWKGKGGVLPAGFDLPTKRQMYDAKLEGLGLTSETVSQPHSPLKEANRLFVAVKRRPRSP